MDKMNDMEYEYYEQMLAIYGHTKKKIEKKLKRINSYGEPEKIINFLKTFIPADIICCLIDQNFIRSLTAKEFVGVQATYFILSCVVIRLLDMSLGKDDAEKRFEKEDLEQLAIDLYDYQEKEKGVYSQMMQYAEKYFGEQTDEEVKVYTKTNGNY